MLRNICSRVMSGLPLNSPLSAGELLMPSLLGSRQALYQLPQQQSNFLSTSAFKREEEGQPERSGFRADNIDVYIPEADNDPEKYHKKIARLMSDYGLDRCVRRARFPRHIKKATQRRREKMRQEYKPIKQEFNRKLGWLLSRRVRGY